MIELDHIVIGCADLQSAEPMVADMLGVPAQGGGKHGFMGTHNKVWSLGSCYLELIAIDPDAAPPGRGRWFSLDDPVVQARLAVGPTLLTWAIRCDDLDGLVAGAATPIGVVESLSRDDLRWKAAIPADGAMPLGGHLPLAIEWLTSSPSERLEDSGLRLSGVTLSRDVVTLLDRSLQSIGARELVSVRDTALGQSITAEIVTADGTISFTG